ncbi:DoxX family protein [Paenibacillus alginolyticus]|uniref:DoxX family protein n=1 Tax=Paenibacillus alginolyticus TaxID=59839 RepID=A0ABT4GA67_9BACL|nr:MULTISPECIES: DoxX family protein [Paenibacillus]MCY9670059.1 DoxX family protein [Paenibacillus alginolyticus]MCY9693090.1 DoxX family protein [Paenibacillus alginolyticus]MEC0147177.1 DoxX family protein [Paenibacillus alginolyticus]NRF90177.1 DoxX family protein [Paenibacillus frigoriresistens]
MTKVTVVATLMRVVLGIIFLAHGISKLQMGLSNVAAWFSSMGVPGILAYVVVVLEVVGGILLIIGLFTRYVSALFIIMLIGAIFTMKLSGGLLGNSQMAGYELDLGFILVAIYLFVSDTSPLSIDQALFRKRGI